MEHVLVGPTHTLVPVMMDTLEKTVMVNYLQSSPVSLWLLYICRCLFRIVFLEQ